MKVTIFSSHDFERPYLEKANQGKHQLQFVNARLDLKHASMVHDSEAVSLFVSDDASAPVLDMLQKQGVKYLALRSAGFNHVDLKALKEYGLKAARVPAYSPHAVAEHAVALMLVLNRHLAVASKRIHEYNFSLDGLTGFNMKGKTVGIIGTGNIGSAAVAILHGFGCRILAYDVEPRQELSDAYGVQYTGLHDLCHQSDIITLHVPLHDETMHMIHEPLINLMKPGVMLINTSRGELLKTEDVLEGLLNGHIGSLGIDVYEHEHGLFFEDHSGETLHDMVLTRLMSLPNVFITGHQGFLTREALENIAATTIFNLDCFEKNMQNSNEL